MIFTADMERKFEVEMQKFLGRSHFINRGHAFAYFKPGWDVMSSHGACISIYFGKFIELDRNDLVRAFETDTVSEYVAVTLSEALLAGDE